MKSDHSIYHVISGNLVRLRTQYRYSQREVADAILISQSTYNRMESGLVYIDVVQLHQLAVFYELPVTVFFGDEACRRCPLRREGGALREASELLLKLCRTLSEGRPDKDVKMIGDVVAYLLQHGEACDDSAAHK